MPIRAASQADVSALGAIERDAAAMFRGTHMDFIADDPTTPADALVAGIAGETLWVATDACGGVVGFLLAAIKGDYLHVLELSVARAAQRQGFGGGLLDAAAAKACALRLRYMSLTTDRSLPWNAPFYARHGFAIADAAKLPDWLAATPVREAESRLKREWRCIMVRAL